MTLSPRSRSTQLSVQQVSSSGNLNGFDYRPRNQFWLFEVDAAMAAVFRDDEFGSRNCVDPFLVESQSDGDPLHLRSLNFVQLF